MARDLARLEAELTEAFTAHRAHLLRWLQRAFRRIGDQADDILQEAFLETLCRVRQEGFRPQIAWTAWLRMVARHRAIDRLRAWERHLFQRLVASGGANAPGRLSPSTSQRSDPAAPGPGPPTQLAEAERRARQGLLLSQVLEDFCRWCEERPQRAPIKEAYERSLRGQAPGQIAAAMGIPADQAYTLLNRARRWVAERVRRADVERSVFLTLFGRQPEEHP